MQSIIKNFFGRHLFLTNTGISFGLSGIGDLLEQKMESNQKQKTKFNINWSRTLHMSTSFGLTSGVLCHFWYNYLDKTLPGRGIKVVVQKIAWDQVSPSLPSFRPLTTSEIFSGHFQSALYRCLPGGGWEDGEQVKLQPGE